MSGQSHRGSSLFVICRPRWSAHFDGRDRSRLAASARTQRSGGRTEDPGSSFRTMHAGCCDSYADGMSPLRPSACRHCAGRGGGVWGVGRSRPGGLAGVVVLHGVLLSALGLALRQGMRAWRQAVAERQRMVRLSSTEPRAVALAAVREERHRLSEDIVGCLRQTLLAVDAEVTATLRHPTPCQGFSESVTTRRWPPVNCAGSSACSGHSETRAPTVSPPPVSQGRASASRRAATS